MRKESNCWSARQRKLYLCSASLSKPILISNSLGLLSRVRLQQMACRLRQHVVTAYRFHVVPPHEGSANTSRSSGWCSAVSVNALPFWGVSIFASFPPTSWSLTR